MAAVFHFIFLCYTQVTIGEGSRTLEEIIQQNERTTSWAYYRFCQYTIVKHKGQCVILTEAQLQITQSFYCCSDMDKYTKRVQLDFDQISPTHFHVSAYAKSEAQQLFEAVMSFRAEWP